MTDPWLWAIIALLCAHCFYFFPGIADDAFISLRYAERLTQGHGLTWNDGEFVEGYSNLLWVLLTAGLHLIGFSLESAARGLGMICTLLTLPALLRFAQSMQQSRHVTFAAMLLFIATPAISIWALRGMETPMVMCCLAWAAVWLRGAMLGERVDALKIGVMLALVCWLRPEGPVYAMAFALGLLCFAQLTWPQKLRISTAILLPPAFAFFAQLGFRLYYYDAWVANTVLVKVTPSVKRFTDGFLYIAGALMTFFPLIAYVSMNLIQARKARLAKGARITPDHAYARAIAFILLFITLAIGAAGGDFFFGYRPFVHIFPLIFMLAMLSLSAGLQQANARREWIFAAVIALAFLGAQQMNELNQPGRDHESNWIFSAIEMGQALKRDYGTMAAPPSIAVFAAGAVPFYSQLPALDVYGLNDRELVQRRHEIANFGHGAIGHELFTAEYILAKKPDILVFDIPHFMPLCEQGNNAAECAKFMMDYRETMLTINSGTARIWVRKNSPANRVN